MADQNHQVESGINEKFLAYAQFPQQLGMIPSPSGYARGVGECGDSLEVFLKTEDGMVKDIRIMPDGCVYTVACASAMADMIMGKSLKWALTLNPETIDEILGGLPNDHMHCARLAINTLGEAIEDCYRKEPPKE